MNLLVVGGGGREHAIIKKLKENPSVETIYALPGNGGIAQDAVCVSEIGAKDIPAIVDFAKSHAIDFAVVAPDDPLALGCVDRLHEAGIPCFGPDAKAARIEASKVFSKNLMKKYGIPTASYEVFDDPAKALEYLEGATFPIVIKADGLALGKGVLIPQSFAEAEEAVKTRSSSPVPRSACWPSLTAPPSGPWCPPWTTSGPGTTIPASIPAAWAPSPPTPATPKPWLTCAWRPSSCPPWPLCGLRVAPSRAACTLA